MASALDGPTFTSTRSSVAASAVLILTFSAASALPAIASESSRATSRCLIVFIPVLLGLWCGFRSPAACRLPVTQVSRPAPAPTYRRSHRPAPGLIPASRWENPYAEAAPASGAPRVRKRGRACRPPLLHVACRLTGRVGPDPGTMAGPGARGRPGRPTDLREAPLKKLVLLSAIAMASMAASAQEVDFNGHTLEIHNDRNVPRIVTMTSPVHQLDGSPEQIIQKVQGCVARNVVNDEVATSGSSASGFFGALA